MRTLKFRFDPFPRGLSHTNPKSVSSPTSTRGTQSVKIPYLNSTATAHVAAHLPRYKHGPGSDKLVTAEPNQSGFRRAPSSGWHIARSEGSEAIFPKVPDQEPSLKDKI